MTTFGGSYHRMTAQREEKDKTQNSVSGRYTQGHNKTREGPAVSETMLKEHSILGWNAASEAALTEQLSIAQEHERIRKLNWDNLRANLAAAALGKTLTDGGKSGKIALAALDVFGKAAEKGNQKRFEAAAMLAAAAVRAGQVDEVPTVDRLVSGVATTATSAPVSPPPRALPMTQKYSFKAKPSYSNLLTGTEKRVARESKQKQAAEDESTRPPTRELMLKLHESLVPSSEEHYGDDHGFEILQSSSLPELDIRLPRRRKSKKRSNEKNDASEQYRAVYLHEARLPPDTLKSSASTGKLKPQWEELPEVYQTRFLRGDLPSRGEARYRVTPPSSSVTALGRTTSPPIRVANAAKPAATPKPAATHKLATTPKPSRLNKPPSKIPFRSPANLTNYNRRLCQSPSRKRNHQRC